MRISRMLAVVMMVPFASQALAENWVTVFTYGGGQTQVDKDSIRRGSDGLVYYDLDDGIAPESLAADCRTRVGYLLELDGDDNPDWRNHGKIDDPNSANEFERAGAAALAYVCANAG